MSFVGNDILLSSKMLNFVGQPITITQDGNGVVSFALNTSAQFKIVEGANGVYTLNLGTVAITDVSGLNDRLTGIDNSYSTLAGDYNELEERVEAIDNATTGTVAVVSGNLAALTTRVDAIDGENGTVATVAGDLAALTERVDKITAGEEGIDLSDYQTTGNISLTAGGADGIAFVTTGTDAAVTVNGKEVVVVDDLSAYQTVAGMSAYQTVAGMSAYQTVEGMSAYQTVEGMSAYQTISEKDAANGYAGLDANGKLAISQLPIMAADGTKIAREYLGALNIQEVFSATITDSTVTIDTTGVTLADVQVGDAIITTSGDMYYRTVVAANDLSDFAKLERDLQIATTADVTAGTADNLFITPAALNASAPTLVGTNFSGIPGTAVSVATADAVGVVKVTVGNGLAIGTDGAISLAVAGTDFGAVKVNAGNGLAIADGVITMSVAGEDFGAVKVTAGNGLAIADGVVSMGVATAEAAGAAKLNGKGIAAGANGSFDVALVTDSDTLIGDGGATALEVRLDPAGAIVATEAGIKLAVDTTLLAIENNTLVNKAVSAGALEDAIDAALVTALANATAALKQEDIKLDTTNYVNGKVTITDPKQHPVGIRHASNGTFFAVSPSLTVSSSGVRTYVIDVTGLTCLDNGDWYVVF